MSAGLGATIYGDKDYDTVIMMKNLGREHAAQVSENSMEPEITPDSSVALIRETGLTMTEQSMRIWNEQTYIKRGYLEEVRLVSINKKI